MDLFGDLPDFDFEGPVKAEALIQPGSLTRATLADYVFDVDAGETDAESETSQEQKSLAEAAVGLCTYVRTYVRT